MIGALWALTAFASAVLQGAVITARLIDKAPTSIGGVSLLSAGDARTHGLDEAFGDRSGISHVLLRRGAHN